ncbi:MAG: DUF1641 domain-containing protein [Chloroflexi bacterium]|nr:DUF1641 domain-containing protein [Chloroflexota bacterium]MCI0646100.1 DUF1641 domain-containing protein [Chloroflexota bacterium]MCI0731574.1 DUF1641 domain-containing protein [Chloroflexota bacterium]
MEQVVAELNQKIDALAAQVAFLAEEARQQQRRRQEWAELQSDLALVGTELFRLSVQQLDEVESYVQLEDVFRLLKRLMRNTRNLEQMLDQLESLAALGQEINPLTQEAFLSVLTRLDEMERKGYFVFFQGGLDIMDRVVTSFSEEDVRQLGENIVLILQTVKEMTQPEIMHMMRQTAAVIREEEPAGDVSLLQILRQLNDPAVKRGLAKTLTVLRTVSEN